jgi:nucleoredoxin
VVLDGAGALITDGGRAEVTADPEGKQFPWIPKSLGDVLDEMTTFQRAGSEEPIQKAALAGKTIGLYFSAHWCGPCRGFTPTLAKTYTAMKAAGNDDFEIVFVSSDRDQAAFDGYLGEMPWLALPFAEHGLKDALSKACKVEGIPTLVIIGPDGTLINADGRAALTKDPTGASFPWPPPPYSDLEDSSSINDEPTVVAFVEGCTDEVRVAVEAGVKDAAEAAAASGGKVKFAVAGPGDGLATRVRALAKLGDAGTQPLLALIDMADSQSFYTAEANPAGTLGKDEIEAFVAAFASGTLIKSKLVF